MRKDTTRATPAHVQGVVTDLRERAVAVGRGIHTRIDQIVTFTLVCPDERAEVIMRADEFAGPLYEGDHVSIGVSPQRQRGATIQTIVLRNLSRNASFGARTGRIVPWRTWLLASAGVLTVLAVAAILLLR